MTIQSEVYVIILITIILGAGIIILSRKIDQADPLSEPKGILLPVLLGIQSVQKNVATNVGDGIADKLTPYILVLWSYIFTSNIISLFGLSSPTSNFSVTLFLSFMTWLLIQITELKYQGVKGYFHGFLEPLAVMLPMNIVGKFSTMVSMAVRLFGNILCGSIMMQLVYGATQGLSNLLAGFLGAKGGVFNFVGPLIAPILHAYFDLFSGFIQTLVFVTLTMVLIGNDIPEDVRKGIA